MLVGKGGAAGESWLDRACARHDRFERILSQSRALPRAAATERATKPRRSVASTFRAARCR
eukprot:COSAG02_NODE_398_length_23118_cov_49.968939_24_plen_61_part_00